MNYLEKLINSNDILYFKDISTVKISGLYMLYTDYELKKITNQSYLKVGITNEKNGLYGRLKNHFSFIEHRHDQSVFSILCKINNIACLSASECEWAEDKNGRFWGHLKDFPILAKRDKKLNFLRRFLSRQNKSLKRFFSK